MSLNSRLDTRTSPLREWFEERLGNVKPLQDEFRRKARQAEPVLPPPSDARPPYSTIGMAVDWRIRHLFTDAPRLDVAEAGIGIAAAHLRRRQEGGETGSVTLPHAFAGIRDSYRATIDELDAAGRLLDGEHERLLSRWCFVLVSWDARNRMNHSGTPGQIPARHLPDTDRARFDLPVEHHNRPT